MKASKYWKNYLSILVLLFVAVLLIYFVGCSKDNTTSPTQMTDDQFLQLVVTSGYDTNSTYEDNLMANERYDMNDSIPVPDQESGGYLGVIDSLYKWGRVVESVNLHLNIVTSSDDSLKTVTVTRTIIGHYIIIGYHNGGQLETVSKPYTEVLNRDISFKRVASFADPRRNWRLYQVSLLSGGTTVPQPQSMAQMISVHITVDTTNVTWSGPDFTQNTFTTLRFGGSGIPHVRLGSTVVIQVTVNSTEQTNYVAWHWARNTFGFHRVPFTFVSSTPQGNGTYNNVYQKIFIVYPTHRLGCFNGYINASTNESLYDDDITLFSSSEVGIPYRVTAQ